MSNLSVRYKREKLHKMLTEKENNLSWLGRNAEKLSFYLAYIAFGLSVLSLFGVIVKILLR